MPEQAPEAPAAEEEGSAPPDVETVVVADPSPERVLNPLTFMGPHGTPPGVKDFRPITTLFKDEDEDHPVEDGQGNHRHPSVTEPKHPSEPRSPQPYDTPPEESGTPEDHGAGSTQGSPFAT